MELVWLTQCGAKVTSHYRQHVKHPATSDFRATLYLSYADDPKGRLKGHPGHKWNSLDNPSVWTPKYQTLHQSVGRTTKHVDGQNYPTPCKQRIKHQHQPQLTSRDCALAGHQSARYLDLTASIETLSHQTVIPLLTKANRIATFRQGNVKRTVHTSKYIQTATQLCAPRIIRTVFSFRNFLLVMLLLKRKINLLELCDEMTWPWRWWSAFMKHLVMFQRYELLKILFTHQITINFTLYKQTRFDYTRLQYLRLH